jgi:CRP-like cAMP-binding protein
VIGALVPDAREVLLTAGGPVRYTPGRVIMREADKTSFVVVLLDGMVKVASAARDGQGVLLAIRTGGDLIGEYAALDGLPRSATVTACGVVHARLLNREEFLGCLRRDPRVDQVVKASVVGQLRTSIAYRVDFTGLDVATRVARVLCQFAKTYGHPVGGSTQIDWPITQQELASLCGAAEPTVQKALRALRAEGVVATGYRSVRVEDFEELSHIAFG